MPETQLKRGALPSPRHALAAATPHVATADVPATYLIKPAQLSMWGNDIHGDCVTAEEAFAKACRQPELFIPEADAIAWATAHGVLEGAYLTDVLTWMQNDGFAEGFYTYDDGPYLSVDWTTPATVRSAIYLGPVKLGIAADQLDGAYWSTSGESGWFATGFTPDFNEDHCTALCGYGSIAWLAEQLGVAVPAGVDGTQPGYAMYTWKSIGIIDHPSMVNITAEAWLRQPTTVPKPLPLGSAPGVAVAADGQQYVFFKGTDGHLWEAFYDGHHWNGPLALGMGSLGSEPAAGVDGRHRQYVFFKGTDNNLWEAFYDGHHWNGPLALGMGPLGSAPAAAVGDDGRQYVFWKGTDNNLWEAFYDGHHWNGPTNRGMGPLGSEPTAGVDSENRQYVFWKGTDNNLWEAFWDTDHWTGPLALGMGPLGSAPGAAVAPDGQQYVFWKGTDGNLWEAFYDGHHWNGPNSRGMGALGSEPTAGADSENRQYVFWKGTDNGLWEGFWDGHHWQGPMSI